MFGRKELHMHNCAVCNNPLGPWTEWKGDDGRFYCSEFCADAGSSTFNTNGAAKLPEIALGQEPPNER